MGKIFIKGRQELANIFRGLLVIIGIAVMVTASIFRGLLVNIGIAAISTAPVLAVAVTGNEWWFAAYLVHLIFAAYILGRE